MQTEGSGDDTSTHPLQRAFQRWNQHGQWLSSEIIHKKHLRTSKTFENTTTSLVLNIPHIVRNIHRYLSFKEQKESRLISKSFDLVATKYLAFKPTLTDTTSSSVLDMCSDLKVDEIRAVGLYKSLPTTEDGKLKCQIRSTGVKALKIFEGVTTSNKIILLRSFPQIEELRYICATNVAPPLMLDGGGLLSLRTLEIQACVYDESGKLTNFFSNEYFPTLENVELHLHTRLDFILYLNVHRFITKHLKSLKKLALSFASDFTFVRENVSNMLRNFPPYLYDQWFQIAQAFENNDKMLDCRFRFIGCEGISRFRLTSILYENQQRINPGGLLLFHGPENLEEDAVDEDDDEDDEVAPEEIEDEVPDDGEAISVQSALPHMNVMEALYAVAGEHGPENLEEDDGDDDDELPHEEIEDEGPDDAEAINCRYALSRLNAMELMYAVAGEHINEDLQPADEDRDATDLDDDDYGGEEVRGANEIESLINGEHADIRDEID